MRKKERMDYLTPEILDIVAEHCGAHEQGSLDRARLARVVKQADFPILPIKDGICVVNVQILGTLAADLHKASMNVYDVASGTIVPVAIRQLEWKMANKPHKTARFYAPCDSIVWTPGKNVWLMQPRDTPLLNVISKMSDQEKRDASPQIDIVPSDFKETRFVNTSDVLDTLAHDLPLLKNVELIGTANEDPVYPQKLLDVWPNLMFLDRISIEHVHLTTAAIQSLADNAPLSLTSLELSYVPHLGSDNHSAKAAILAIADLALRWRPSIQRKLILDGQYMPLLHLVLYGIGHPTYDFAFTSDNSFLSNDGIFFSADAHSNQQILNAADAAQTLTTLFPTVTLKTTTLKTTKTSNLKQPNLPFNQSSYTNPRRELIRYMWQYKDHTCKHCATLWPKHAVTISWRETCVSMCFKGKKMCTQRPEYARVQQGHLFITDKHVQGNGGLDLTPTPHVVLHNQPKLAAIEPHTKRLLIFTDHETTTLPRHTQTHQRHTNDTHRHTNRRIMLEDLCDLRGCPKK